MPKRSDIEAQIAKLQADLDSADTDDEIWLKDESGTEVKVSGRRATAVLARFKGLWDTAEEGEEGEPEEEATEDPKPPAGYFGRRK